MILTDKLKQVILHPPVRDIRHQTAYYPSSASCITVDPDTGLRKAIGSCLRKQWYAIKGVTPTDPGDSANQLKKEMGGVIQALIEDKLKAAGLWMASETRIWIPKYKLSGRIDSWVWDPKTLDRGGAKVPIMVEFKSTGRFQEPGTIKLSKGKLLPKDEHVAQVLPYLDFYSQYPGYFHGEPVRCIVFVIGRDSMEWCEHVVFLGGSGHFGMPLKEEDRYAIVQNQAGTFQLKYITLKGIYNRWLQLTEFLRQKQIPDRDYELQYSNDKLAKLVGAGQLSKTDVGKIAKAQKGDPEGKGCWLPKGDWQCGWCDWKTHCYQGIKHKQPDIIAQEQPSAGVSTPAPVTEPIGET